MKRTTNGQRDSFSVFIRCSLHSLGDIPIMPFNPPMRLPVLMQTVRSVLRTVLPLSKHWKIFRLIFQVLPAIRKSSVAIIDPDRIGLADRVGHEGIEITITIQVSKGETPASRTAEALSTVWERKVGAPFCRRIEFKLVGSQDAATGRYNATDQRDLDVFAGQEIGRRCKSCDICCR